MAEPAATVTVRFELRRADLLWANLWWLSRKWSFVMIYVIFGSAFVLGLIAGIASHWRHTSPIQLLVFVAMLVLLPGAVLLQVVLNFRQLKPEQIEKCYSFGQEGFAVADGLARADVSWKGVRRAVETKRAFHLFVFKQVFHVVPRRAFSDAELVQTRTLLKDVLGGAAKLRADRPDDRA